MNKLNNKITDVLVESVTSDDRKAWSLTIASHRPLTTDDIVSGIEFVKWEILGNLRSTLNEKSRALLDEDIKALCSCNQVKRIAPKGEK